jgi:hypothetical protein
MARAARDAALSRMSKRMRAPQTRLGPLIDTLPNRIELPPLIMREHEQLTDLQISAGVPWEYETILVRPATSSDEPEAGKRMWLRIAFRA